MRWAPWGGGGGAMGVVFRVRPAVLLGCAQALREEAVVVADAAAAVAGVRVAAEAFGRLPQSGTLAAGYEGHHRAEVTGITEVVAAVEAVARAVRSAARRYGAAEAGVHGAVRGVARSVERTSADPTPSRAGAAGAVSAGDAAAGPGVSTGGRGAAGGAGRAPRRHGIAEAIR